MTQEQPKGAAVGRGRPRLDSHKVTMSVRSHEFEWFSRYPIHTSPSSSLRLLLRLAMKQLVEATDAILEKFDAAERKRIVETLDNYKLSDLGAFDHEELQAHIRWRFELGGVKADPELERLFKRIIELDFCEKTALFSWALSFWNQSENDARVKRSIPHNAASIEGFCAGIGTMIRLMDLFADEKLS